MASVPTTAANDPTASSSQLDDPLYDIDHRLSLELIIAFVAPVGSGASTTYQRMADKLRKEYDYDIVYIRMSSIIKDHAAEVGEPFPDDLSPIDRIDKYQNVGNALRKKFGASYLADRAIERIAIERDVRGGYKSVDGKRIVTPSRRAYFIDSLKNPAELSRLRQIYNDLLWVVSIFAPEDTRLRRLKDANVPEDVARHAMKRDLEEEEKSGQKVSKIAHQANYFIRNSFDRKEGLDEPISRFLETIFGVKLHTPTLDEKGMLEASSAAVRSACLSRQVGAAIYSKSGELIGVGCNDVPRFGGGLYKEGADDNRCYKWKEGQCHNDERKRSLSEKIVNELGAESEQNIESVGKTMDVGVGNLIEFSRSVHAEMEAIVSVARAGSGSTIEATLYTTTFPCHNCARHIVASGITTVFYVEPYSKSLALELHSDSISLDEREASKVKFLQYQGFSPRTSMRLFSSAGRERKEGGKYRPHETATARPIFATPLDSYVTAENLIVQQLNPAERDDGQA